MAYLAVTSFMPPDPIHIWHSRIIRSNPSLVCLFFAATCVAADPTEELRQRGEQIYRKSCLGCHGENGVGVEDHYADPLVGDASIEKLANQINETMPEEDPESCVGEDAVAVATYVHQAFYSEAAQARNRPPRIRLARLTGEQLRSSLADLYASFDFPSFIDKTAGNF